MYVLSHILFILGYKLQPAKTHLISSIEVSQWFAIDILSDCIESSERNT
jgi:hypothetical protein